MTTKQLKAREWYLKNREKTIAKAKQWTEANREKSKSFKTKWRNNNIDKAREIEAASRKRYKKEKKLRQIKYRKDHPGKAAAYCAKRRAYKLQATPKWLTPLQLEHIALFYEAAAFMTKEVGIEFHVDHRIPLRGKEVWGLHVPWNLQVLTAEDNCKKNNKICL